MSAPSVPSSRRARIRQPRSTCELLLDDLVQRALDLVNRLGKLPCLKVEEGDRTIPESSIIIEYIDRHCPGGTKLIPDDADLARQVRFHDRIFDLYVNEPSGKIFFDGMRPEGMHDTMGVKQAHERIQTTPALVDDLARIA